MKNLKKIIILKKAKKLYAKANDKVKLIWYLSEKFPDKSDKQINKFIKKAKELV